MRGVSVAIFWTCAVMVLYTYLGYPLFLRLLVSLRRLGRPSRSPIQPTVSIVVAAYNEAKLIGNRLENIAEMDYSPKMVEVIVASDGSTDQTNEIVSAWPDQRVRLLALPRGGRACAHNGAVRAAKGDIVVFTDARTSFRRDFLSNILVPFAGPEVGCVVGRLVYMTERHTLGDRTRTYWHYETKLREWESDLGCLAVSSGCCMAIRRGLFRELPHDEDVDDAVPLDVLLQGCRVIFAPDALAFDVPPSTPRDEIRARARMTVLALTAILRRKSLLNPFRFPRLAFSLFSHRIFRSLTPAFACGGLLFSALLVGQPLYRVIFVAQLVFYVFAFFGWVVGGQGFAVALLRLPLSFCVWNIGFAAGLVRVLRGQTVTTYTPVREEPHPL